MLMPMCSHAFSTPSFADCHESCESSETCWSSCSCLESSSSIFSNSTSSLAINGPYLHCQDFYEFENGTSSVSVYLKWDLISATKPSVNFIVDQQRKGAGWRTLGMTEFGLQPITSLSPGESYRWRLKAVSHLGDLSDTKVSQMVQMFPSSSVPQPSPRIYVKDVFPYNNYVGVTISWDPPPDRLCSADVFWYYDGSESIGQIEVKQPYDAFRARLAPLEFDANYTIQVISVTRGMKRESQPTTTKFLTPSCLSLYNMSFDRCAPPVPRNLSLEVVERKIFAPFGPIRDRYYLKAVWLPPCHAVGSNKIIEYHVKLIQKPKLGASWTLQNLAPVEIVIPGNQHGLTFDRIFTDAEYVLYISAISNGGEGKSVFTSVVTPGESSTNPFLIPVTIVTVIFFVGVLCVCTVMLWYRCYRKYRLKEDRRKYFETLEKLEDRHDESVCLEQKQSTDDYEIPYKNLLLGEIIGEGAFGTVRKAQIRFMSPLSLGLWKTVAVKQLKYSAKEDDREQLIKEIEVMKSVGHHPHIVNLIGACTSGPKLCLVVEHCAGGDLLTFLRDVYCEMTSSENYHYRSAKRKKYGLQYAELLIEEEDEEKSVDKIAREDLQIQPFDLLSIARQVTLGMEYLSTSKIVHRDLAARNILLTENRTVKISDFGLSRDVYERNLYQKSGGGKLPIKWLSPESLMHQIYTTKSDIWSFGVLLWEIITLGGSPYPGMSANEVVSAVLKGYRMEKPENCGTELYAIMLSCWEQRPSDRASFARLKEELEKLMEDKGSEYLTLQSDVISLCQFDEYQDRNTKLGNRGTTSSSSGYGENSDISM